MLARVLALHPELGAFHEPRPWLNTEAFFRWADRRGHAYAKRRLGEARDDLIHAIDANQLMYVESSHFLSHLVPDLEDLYEPKFVHLFRDGRDFVRSGLEMGFYQGRGRLGEVKRWVRQRTGLKIGNVWEDHRLSPPRDLRSPFERTAWLWAEINGEILSHLADIPRGRRASVPLEEFGSSQLRDLLEFLGVDLDRAPFDSMLELAEARPNRTEERELPGPELWSDERRNRFREIAGSMMRRLGYGTE